MGLIAAEEGEKYASQVFGVEVSLALYWKRKVTNPNYHSGRWGGTQTYKYDPVEPVQAALWQIIRANTGFTLQEIKKSLLDNYQYDYSRNWISKKLKAWRWSMRKVSPTQYSKYTFENISYYLRYVTWFHDLGDWRRVKFMDEVHFNYKDFQTRARAWGPVNTPRTSLAHGNLSMSFSASVMISADPAQEEPTFVDIREQSNSGDDFATFIQACISFGFLRAGDILIFDNAAVHCDVNTFEEIYEMLAAANVDTRRLPTYSPELNPIEKVFNIVKHYLRYNRENGPFLTEVLKGFSKVTKEIVVKEYLCAINYNTKHPFRLPPEINFMADDAT